MTMLLVSHSAQLGGAEIALENLSVELGPAAHVLLLEQGPLEVRLKERGVRVTTSRTEQALSGPLRGRHRLVRKALGAAKANLVVRGELNRLSREIDGPPVVVLNSLRALLLAIFARLTMRRSKFVLMLRDGLCEPYFTRAEATATKCVVRFLPHAVIANSRWTASFVKRRHGVAVVPPLLSRSFFSPVVEPPADEFRILILGRIARWKGQLVGLQAVAKLAQRHRLSVTVAGGPWFGEEAYFKEIIEAAKELPVDVVGHIDDVRSLIDRSHLVLHTSVLPEPFGQVVLQAMARGRIVAATDVGGPRETITDRVDGLLYTAGNARQLSSLISEVYEEWSNLSNIRNAARLKAEEYHPTISLEKFRKALRELDLKEVHCERTCYR